jgi:hypothetical protein
MSAKQKYFLQVVNDVRTIELGTVFAGLYNELLDSTFSNRRPITATEMFRDFAHSLQPNDGIAP